MTRYGVAIHGAGNITRSHIKAYLNNPHTEVVAICDVDEARARERVAEFGLSCALYTDYDRLLADPAVDIVSICTPNYRHAAETIQAAEAGKHILIEKPIATRLEDLSAIRQAVRAAGVKTVVGFVTRYLPLFKAIKAILDANTVGRVLLADVDYWYHLRLEAHQYREWWTRQSLMGSATLSSGCYAVDTIRWFVGSEVSEVMAYAVRGLNPDPEYETTVLAALRFANGAIGKISASMEAKLPYLLNVELLGDYGAIRNNVLYTQPSPGQNEISVIPGDLPSADLSRIPFQAEIDHFVDCILTDVESPVNLEDGIKTHEVCLAIDLSAAEGRPVRLPLITP